MTRSHNIVGCEASTDPHRRLVEFSHVHGAMAWGGPPRRARAPIWLAFVLFAAFLAGAACAAVGVLYLLSKL